MTHFLRSSASKTTKAIVVLAFLAGLSPLTTFAQQFSRPPITYSFNTQRASPAALKSTLEKVSFSSFDIRVMQGKYFFRQTGFDRSTLTQVNESIDRAVSAAKSIVGNPPSQPRVVTPQGTQIYLQQVKDHNESISRMIDRQIDEIASPQFLQFGLSESDLNRLQQVWLQLTGPNSDILRDLGVSEAQLRNIENQMKEVRASARKQVGDDAVFRTAATGTRRVLRESLNAEQWSLWTQLIGKEVEVD